MLSSLKVIRWDGRKRFARSMERSKAVKYNTKYLGVVEIEEDKILTFEQGIFGFENYKKFALLYQGEGDSVISWLQSLEEEALALPIIQPQYILENYNPVVDDEVIHSLGEPSEKNIAVFLTLTVPTDITKMTSNLKAPLIINVTSKKGCQVIAENPDYVIKYPVYELFAENNAEKGESEC